MSRKSIPPAAVKLIKILRQECDFSHATIAHLAAVSKRTVSRVLQAAGMVRHHPDTMLHGNASNGVANRLRAGDPVWLVAALYQVSTDTVERIASLNNIRVRSVTKRHNIAKFNTNLHTKLMMARGKYKA